MSNAALSTNGSKKRTAAFGHRTSGPKRFLEFEHFRDQHPHCAMADLLRRVAAMDTQHHGYANDFATGLELAMARAFSSRKAK